MATDSQTLRDTKTGETYNETPYESYAYPLTHPEHQAVVAMLMGLEPADITKARVLELGCAGGGNILPLAMDFPDAEFFGNDLSPVQIDEANGHKKNLGLENITFEALDIMDLNEKDHGKFDYIICHGVFSWVPDFVREKILKICQEQLTPNGLACISYNVMPGWGPLRSVREMLLIHTTKFETNAEKIDQAKLLVRALNEFMPEGTSMRKAVETVKENFATFNNDSYILHEYLETENNPFFFSEFAEMIKNHDLQYVGDSSIEMLHTSNLPEKTQEFLNAIKDVSAKEQYIDFFSNRQFRYSIISHKDTKPADKGLDIIESMYFSAELIPLEVKDNTLHTFVEDGTGGGEIVLNDPNLAHAFRTMCESPNARFSYQELLGLVLKNADPNQKATYENLTKSILVQILLKNALKMHLAPSNVTKTNPKKPKVKPYTKYQAQQHHAKFIFSANYEMIPVDDVQKEAIKMMNGNKTINEIKEELLKTIKNGNIKIFENNAPIRDPSKQKRALDQTLSQAIEKMGKKGFFIE